MTTITSSKLAWHFGACALLSTVVVAIGTAKSASALDPVEVASCNGTTSTAEGVVNTPPSSITLHDTLAGDAGQVTDLQDGKTVFLYDNMGRMVAQPDGTYVGAQGGIPLCGVHLDGGELISEWSFCTDEDLGGCADTPPDPVAGNPKLTSDQDAIIAYLLFHGDTSTKRSRATLQVQIWCISEGVAAGAVNSYSGDYFNGYQFDDPGVDSESMPLTDAEVTCYDQQYRDTAIASIPETAEFSITGPADPIEVPGTAEFALVTNFSGRVELAITGATAVTLCPDDTSTAELTGTTLALSAPSTVLLCATRATEGDVILDATAQRLTRDSVTWVHADGCQHFSTFTRALSEVGQDSATASFVVVPEVTSAPTSAPTTTSTTVEPTTTSNSTTIATDAPTTTGNDSAGIPTTVGGTRGLPATGANSSTQLWFVGLFLALGGVLVLLTRRRPAPRQP